MNTLNIDKNAKSISELIDLMMGLSVQITKVVFEKDNESQVNNVLVTHTNGNQPYQ